MSETSEQATRRRWVTLAEVVAVAGVLIAALTLWSNWSDRRADEAEKVAERTAERTERSRIDLTATVEDGGRRLALKDEKHDLQDLAVAFPRALGVAAKQPMSDVAILADWFEAPLLKLTDGGADEREGRLPVLVTVRYWDGDTQRSATGVYNVIWRTEGRLLRGRTVKLEGLRLRQRGGGQAQVDALWAKEKP
ncbi:hypothetical protein ASG67_06415 [Sphingomonas sp. Leaf339]|uniref:hypothetical protein n=1 Tax=Sphingomonas sp. Leaf339 TaxID=1736343 RepID=UPI0006F3A5EB|nr:hypothetical protein [Sphingomonas sp. Leaf339]KQU55750.1 hypothetical protein ASG67_06415 [Sphingomonas sp. Leaf339]